MNQNYFKCNIFIIIPRFSSIIFVFQLLPHFVMEVFQDLPGLPGLFVACMISGALRYITCTIKLCLFNFKSNCCYNNVDLPIYVIIYQINSITGFVWVFRLSTTVNPKYQVRQVLFFVRLSHTSSDNAKLPTFPIRSSSFAL